jgi:hypothetical protein
LTIAPQVDALVELGGRLSAAARTDPEVIVGYSWDSTDLLGAGTPIAVIPPATIPEVWSVSGEHGIGRLFATEVVEAVTAL